MDVQTLVDEGLGNASYLVDLGDGRALAVDPSRDPRRYLARADDLGLTVAVVAETHVHADFLSGGRELAGLGAKLLAPARAGLSFEHRGLDDGEEVSLGGLTLRAIATGGHSPEHLSYLLLDGPRPLAVFTGGALIVGGVARTDLADPDRTEQWARAAYASAQRLLGLPDDTAVYPTHGPGSFCSAGEPGSRVTTVGTERTSNPLLAGADEDIFVTRLLDRLGSYPTYFGHLPAVNRRGAARYGRARPPLALLTPSHVAELVEGGAALVDARPIEEFAAGHIPKAVSIAFRPAFSTWLGWLSDPDRPLVLVLGTGQDRDAVVEACLNVGHDALAGELDGGMPAWTAAGRPVAAIPLIGAGQASDRLIDVRQESEWRAGHVPGAVHHELGGLPMTAAGLAGGRPATVMCGHGERSMTGASLLAAAGSGQLTVLRGGPPEWAAAHGKDLEYGA